jgi:hypothetical protein
VYHSQICSRTDSGNKKLTLILFLTLNFLCWALNAITKFFSFATKKVTQPPEFQAFTLLNIYYLSALTMEASLAFTVSRILNKQFPYFILKW